MSKGKHSGKSLRAAARFSRRQFLVRSAAGVAGASMSSLGFPWGDLAYGQQLKGKPVNINVAVRPDWTQGWFGVVNEEKKIWKKYLPEGSEVTFTHPIQGGIVTNELIANKTQIGHNGDAPGLIATFQRERADIRAVGLIGSSPSGYHCYQILARTDAPEFKDSKEAMRWFDGKVVATPEGQLLGPLLPGCFQTRRHQAKGISQPANRRHHHQSARQENRRRGDLGSARCRGEHDRR